VKTRDITPQVRAFLLQGVRTGKVATVDPDRLPHVVPVWFHLDGDEIIFITGNNTMKAKNLRREDHVAMCVDDEHPPYAYAEIEGTVKISNDPKELLDWATVIAERYMGQERAEEYGQINSGPGELLVRILPRKVIFEDKIAEL
jgi:PPOX class probable F420-dependent enzyme